MSPLQYISRSGMHQPACSATMSTRGWACFKACSSKFAVPCSEENVAGREQAIRMVILIVSFRCRKMEGQPSGLGAQATLPGAAFRRTKARGRAELCMSKPWTMLQCSTIPSQATLPVAVETMQQAAPPRGAMPSTSSAAIVRWCQAIKGFLLVTSSRPTTSWLSSNLV